MPLLSIISKKNLRRGFSAQFRSNLLLLQKVALHGDDGLGVSDLSPFDHAGDFLDGKEHNVQKLPFIEMLFACRNAGRLIDIDLLVGIAGRRIEREKRL